MNQFALKMTAENKPWWVQNNIYIKITLTWVHSDIHCIYICKCVWHTNLLCNDYIEECTKKYESHNFIVLFSKQSHCKKNLDFSYKNMLQLSKRKTISSWTVEHFQVHNRLLFTWLHWEDVQDSWSSLAQPVPAHVLQRQARFRKTIKKPGPQRQWWQVQVLRDKDKARCKKTMTKTMSDRVKSSDDMLYGMMVFMSCIIKAPISVDWLLIDLLRAKMCRPLENSKNCLRDVWIQHSSSLFQHMGTHSSLSGKLQLLKDKKFWPYKCETIFIWWLRI